MLRDEITAARVALTRLEAPQLLAYQQLDVLTNQKELAGQIEYLRALVELQAAYNRLYEPRMALKAYLDTASNSITETLSKETK